MGVWHGLFHCPASESGGVQGKAAVHDGAGCDRYVMLRGEDGGEREREEYAKDGAGMRGRRVVIVVYVVDK